MSEPPGVVDEVGEPAVNARMAGRTQRAIRKQCNDGRVVERHRDAPGRVLPGEQVDLAQRPWPWVAHRPDQEPRPVAAGHRHPGGPGLPGECHRTHRTVGDEPARERGATLTADRADQRGAPELFAHQRDDELEHRAVTAIGRRLGARRKESQPLVLAVDREDEPAWRDRGGLLADAT
jgi:hypothetical protein